MSRKLCEAEGIFEDVLVESLKPLFLKRFGKAGQLDIRALLTGLKTVQDFDNVERQRVMMKRQISAAPGGSAEKGMLEARLASQEHLWELLERDRAYRAGAIEWLKTMEDRRADTAQLMDAFGATFLRAWFLDGTISGDRLTALWLDGSQDEVRLDVSKKQPVVQAIRKGENEP